MTGAPNIQVGPFGRTLTSYSSEIYRDTAHEIRAEIA
jgi:hypothetical protein